MTIGMYAKPRSTGSKPMTDVSVELEATLLLKLHDRSSLPMGSTFLVVLACPARISVTNVAFKSSVFQALTIIVLSMK